MQFYEIYGFHIKSLSGRNVGITERRSLWYMLLKVTPSGTVFIPNFMNIGSRFQIVLRLFGGCNGKSAAE
jgi:hypothetical protein